MAPAEEELTRAREQGGEDARSVTEQLAPDDPARRIAWAIGLGVGVE
jgi:hypothetical protein